MARQKSPLENRTARRRLETRRKPYFDVISPGISLGYRRVVTGAGRWVLRAADGAGGSWTQVIGIADDYEAPNASVCRGCRMSSRRSIMLSWILRRSPKLSAVLMHSIRLSAVSSKSWRPRVLEPAKSSASRWVTCGWIRRGC